MKYNAHLDRILIGCLAKYGGTDIRDFPDPDDGPKSLEKNIAALHELEIKHFIVREASDYDIIPKRKANILKRIERLADEYFEACKEEIGYGFERWLSEHKIEDADEWADMVYEEFTEIMGWSDDKIIEHVNENGGFERGAIKTGPIDWYQYVNTNEVKQHISEDVYNNLEVYSYQAKEWLDANYPDWEDPESYEMSDEQAVEYIKSKGLHSAFEDYMIENTDLNDMAREYDMSYLINEHTIKEVIKRELYPSYMSTFGGQVQSIIDDVREALSRLDDVSESDNISEKTAAISLALNVYHVGGNIMQDCCDISPDFLDDLHESQEAEEWKEEAEEEFFLKRNKKVFEPVEPVMRSMPYSG